MNGKINFSLPTERKKTATPKQAEKFFSKQLLTGQVLSGKTPTGPAPAPADPSTSTGYGRTK